MQVQGVSQRTRVERVQRAKLHRKSDASVLSTRDILHVHTQWFLLHVRCRRSQRRCAAAAYVGPARKYPRVREEPARSNGPRCGRGGGGGGGGEERKKCVPRHAQCTLDCVCSAYYETLRSTRTLHIIQHETRHITYSILQATTSARRRKMRPKTTKGTPMHRTRRMQPI